ncbi:MAG: response regulator [Dysgonamonadaceae bacterium]|jgi:signal transduction histidine kinase/ligand-binding sensor domain-containing protein/DNA-binding response OmpR family regulator|nr:response regulator [Dysgonamonadaceae bacterium]
MKSLFLFFFFLSLQFNLYAQFAQYREPQLLGFKQGLSSYKTAAIAEDKQGFIWVATENGLNRFDGNHFKNYIKIEGDATSLLNNHVTTLLNDSENRLWIASMTGLQLYNRDKDCFEFQTLGLESSVTGNKSFKFIKEDAKKYIWFSVNELGVIRYSPLTNQSRLFVPDSANSICSKYIRCIDEDDKGNIWFASMGNGISVYNSGKDIFTHYNRSNSNLPTDEIISICHINNGNMLIASVGKGLCIFDAKEKKFKSLSGFNTAFCLLKLRNNKIVVGTEGDGLFYTDISAIKIVPFPDSDNPIIKDNKIHSMIEDNNGNLWIGVFNEGLCLLRREPEGFKAVKKKKNNFNSLNYGQITGIDTDKEGNIWYATDGGGLNYFDKEKGKYSYYKKETGKAGSISDNAVVSILCDKRGIVWAGTYYGGLCKFDKSNGLFTVYMHDEAKNSLPCDYVKCIIEDGMGGFWLGTDGKGISHFNPISESFENYSVKQYPELICDNTTFLFLEDNRFLWIGTYSGLSRFDTEKRIFKSYDTDKAISNLSVYSIAEDQYHNIWAGTSNGLKYYDRKTDAFISQELSLHHDFQQPVYGIVPFEDNLWLSTDKGIYCRSIADNSLIYYINNEDLGGINFLRSSYCITSDDEIFFGGSNGCYAFHPDDLLSDNYFPNSYITNFKIFNRSIRVGQEYNGRVILSESLDKVKKISLKYSENNFTIDFSVPNNPLPYSTIYSYCLKGVDNEWRILPEGQQSLNYINLPPGNYSLNISASYIPNTNPDNYISLNIEILPPPWLTWYAKTAYIAAALLLLMVIFYTINSRIKDRNKLKMMEMLDRSKMQFFNNVSHEFRTPLTLIISPLEELLNEELNLEKSRLYKIMLRNARRLLQLIKQILDLKKIAHETFFIKVQPIELSLFIEDFIELFADIAKRKKINVSFENHAKDVVVWYDPDYLEKCLYNLLSNAIKYTPQDGKIAISIQSADGKILLNISDNGEGIEKEEIPLLFDRFYQGTSTDNSGYGIGLHLVKNIVERHGGTIEVASEKGKGSYFTIRILQGNAHFLPEQIVDEKWEPVDFLAISHPDKAEDSIDDAEKQTVMIVEDDPDMRDYLCYELKNKYRIIDAQNGKEAIYKLRFTTPNIIITDVVMPEMNGIELCRIVKENIETCNIPVIMLSVNSRMENRLEGLETGADCYISKPFNSSQLKSEIKRMLDKHEKIKRIYIDTPDFEAQIKDIDDPEELLLKNLIKNIHIHIADSDLSVNKLAALLYTSRTNLHRKVKAMTGLSPVELIKTIRMKEAVSLLDSGKLQISEVAFRVGYNSLSYFSSSFNSYWGIAPTEYIKKVLGQQSEDSRQ